MDKQILSNAITTLTTHAEANGLTSPQIKRLVDVLVMADGLDRGSVSKIVGSLYPSGKVEEDNAVKVIACLGLGSERAPLPTQVCLIDDKSDWEDISVKVAGNGVSIFGVAEGASAVIWSDIPLPQLRLPSA